MDSNLIISIKETRELLGDEAKDMSDKEVEQLIRDIDMMARYALSIARQKTKMLSNNSSSEV